MKKICKHCGKEFEKHSYQHIFCSEKCRKAFSAKPIQKKFCPVCGKEFKPNSSRHTFCSRKCQRKFYSKPIPKKICPICGKEFEPHRRSQIYCSSDCRIYCSIKYFKKYIVPKKPPKPCKTLEDWRREAAELHMDYGNYRAQVEIFGKSFEELKSREV